MKSNNFKRLIRNNMVKMFDIHRILGDWGELTHFSYRAILTTGKRIRCSTLELITDEFYLWSDIEKSLQHSDPLITYVQNKRFKVLEKTPYRIRFKLKD